MIGTKTFDALELRKNRIGWNAFNRWYDPEVGRWISEDPIGFEAGDTNLYRYVGNGVTNKVDPSALHFIDADGDGDGKPDDPTPPGTVTASVVNAGKVSDLNATVWWHPYRKLARYAMENAGAKFDTTILGEQVAEAYPLGIIYAEKRYLFFVQFWIHKCDDKKYTIWVNEDGSKRINRYRRVHQWVEETVPIADLGWQRVTGATIRRQRALGRTQMAIVVQCYMSMRRMHRNGALVRKASLCRLVKLSNSVCS